MKNIRAGLFVKFILSISIVILITSVSLTWFFLKSQVVQMQRALENRCESLARSLAYNGEYGVLTGNKEYLRNLTRGVNNEDDVIYSLIHDKKGRVLAYTAAFQKNGKFNELGSSFLDSKIPAEKLRAGETSALQYSSEKGEPMYEAVFPVVVRHMGGQREMIGFLEDGGATPAKRSSEWRGWAFRLTR